MDVDDIGLGVEMVVPYMFEQHRPGDHPSGAAHQAFEKLELAPLQVDLAAGAGDPARQQIHFEIAHPQHGLLRRRRAAPEQRVDPRAQLGERERLHQIVVGAGPEPGDPVLDLSLGAQEQDRCFSPRAAHRPDDGDPVELGQHAVDHRHVVVAAERQHEPVAAVMGDIDGKPALGKPLGDETRRFGVVFDDQCAHRRTGSAIAPPATGQAKAGTAFAAPAPGRSCGPWRPVYASAKRTATMRSSPLRWISSITALRPSLRSRSTALTASAADFTGV